MFLNKDHFQIYCIEFEFFVTFATDMLHLDLSKIDMNSQDLMQLRSRSVKEQKKLQDTGGRKGRNELETKRVSQLI